MKDEDKKAVISKRINSLSPYQFVTKHLELMKASDKFDKERYSEDEILKFKYTYNLISGDLNKDLNEMLRIVEIEKDLIKLIENTENKIFYRKLFFPSIFINNEFIFEDWIIKGILVEECLTDFKTGIASRSKEEKNDYIMFIVAIDRLSLEFWNLNFFLMSKSAYPKENPSKVEQLKKMEFFLRNIVCNIVDMVDGNDEDLSVVVIETSKEQNQKRILRKKIPFPTKIYIRAKGEFKKYVQNFNNICEDKGKLGHRFLVRGHWRDFRSKRFIHKKGERTWIKPFWKGEGIVISKDYKLIRS